MYNEYKNQCCHVLLGIIISALFYYWFNCFVELAVFMTSLGVEIYQYFYRDKKELKLADRILDISFYQVGVAIFLIIINVYKG